jgi:hypothetical protein
MEIELEKLQNTLSLERLSGQAILEIPQIQREMESVKAEIEKFKVLVYNAREKLQRECQKTSIFDELGKLDQVVRNMIATRSCLKDADNWNTVAAEMESLIASMELEQAAVRLKEAENSLEILSNSINYNERKDLLLSLKSKFVTLIKSTLTAAIKQNDIEEMKRNVEICETSNQDLDAIELFFELRKDIYWTFWSNLQNSVDLVANFTIFFSSTLEELANDYNIFQSIFNSPDTKMNSFILKLLSNLNPSIDEMLHKVVNDYSERSINIVIGLFTEFVKFGLQMEARFKNDGEIPEWGEVLFKQFKAYQKSYELIESKVLMESTHTFTKTTLNSSLEAIMTVAEEAIDRYFFLVFASSKVDIFKILNDYFSASLGKLAENYNHSVYELERNPNITSLHANMFKVDELFSSNLQKEIENLRYCYSFCKKIQALENTSLQNYHQLPLDFEQIIDSKLCKQHLFYTPEKSNGEHINIMKWGFKKTLDQIIAKFQRDLIDCLLTPISDFIMYIPYLSVWTAESSQEEIVAPLPYITCIGNKIFNQRRSST